MEKVLFELAHGVNRERFSATVVYLLEEKNPINYDQAIQTICLQPIINQMLKPKVEKERGGATSQLYYPPVEPMSLRKKLTAFLRSIYNILPQSLREQLRLHDRFKFLKPLLRRCSSNPAPVPVVPQVQFEPTKLTVQPVVEVKSAYFVTLSSVQNKYEITNAIAELWVPAMALRKVLEDFSQDSLLIPMDEYLTTMLWIAQLPPFRKVLASQHYPYSKAQPLRYPDEQVRKVKEWVYLNACKSAEVVTFDSEGSRMDFVNNYGASPKRTISMPNLINCELIQKKARQPLNVDPECLKGKTVFTQVARLSLEKNPLLLVDACDILRKEFSNFVVLYVGNGPLEEAMRQKIQQKKLQNHILMLGELANPYPHMAAARGLLLTSRSESSPLVLVECMLCGAVPISTDCVAGPRELLQDGKLGMLVPPGDPKAFAEAMYQIAKDDQLVQRLRTNARERALRYDTPRVIKEWEDLIWKVAQNVTDDYSK